MLKNHYFLDKRKIGLDSNGAIQQGKCFKNTNSPKTFAPYDLNKIVVDVIFYCCMYIKFI